MGKLREGQVAIVTGSSRGIGKAIAIALAKKGLTIVLNGRNEERLLQARDEVQTITENVVYTKADVSKPEEAKDLIDKTITTFGRLDVLVNNVGVSMRGKVADVDPSVVEQVFESNVYGAFNPAKYAIPHLRKAQGSIVFISSLAGIRGLPGLSIYCSSKMALRALAESIRIEEKQNNIHVGLVYVGITEIEHNKEAIAQDGSKQVLQDRKKGKVQSTEYVAKKTIQNIERKKHLTTLTGIGKINRFLQARFPLIVEKIILKNLHKFEEKSK